MASQNSGIRPPAAGVAKSRMPQPTKSLALPRAAGAVAMKKGHQGQDVRDSVLGPRGASESSSTDKEDPLAPDTDSFIIGETIWVGGTSRGKIAFIGETQFAKGEWAGIVLDEPTGKNDGTISGIRYFQCEQFHGTFCRLSRLFRAPLVPIDPTKECEVHGSTPPRCLVERQRSPSPFTSKSPSPGLVTPSRLGSPSMVKVGERVIVQSATGTKRGILRFLGNTEFASGEWAGIELDQAIGKNDGAVGGVRYFQCKNNYGLFAPIHKISSSPMNKRPSSLRRYGSKESMTSNMSSIASSMAVRSVRKPPNTPSQLRSSCLPSCTLQTVLKEKEKHLESLIQEKDLDRHELAEKTSQLERLSEDLHRLREELHMCREDSSRKVKTDLEKLQAENNSVALKLEEALRKHEDLLFSFEEQNIIKSDLIAQLEALRNEGSETNEALTARFTNELKCKDDRISQLQEELSKSLVPAAKPQLAESATNTDQDIRDDAKLAAAANENEIRLKKLQDSLVELENEQQRLTATLGSKNEQLVQTEIDLKKLKEQLQERDLEIQDLQVRAAGNGDLAAQSLDSCREVEKKLELAELNEKQNLESIEKLKQELEARNLELKNALETTKLELASKDDKIQNGAKEIAAMKLNIESLERSLSEVSQAKTELTERERKSSAELISLKDELAKLSKRFEESQQSSEQEVSRLKSENEKAVQLNAALAKQLELQLSELKTTLVEKDKALSSTSSNLEEVTRLSSQHALQVENDKATIKKLESQLSAALEDKERILTSMKASSEEEKDKLISQMNSESSQRAEEIRKLEAKITEFKKTVDETNSSLEQATRLASENSAQLEESKATIRNLQTNLSTALEEKEQTLASMKASAEEEKNKVISQMNLDNSKHAEEVKTLEAKVEELKKAADDASSSLEKSAHLLSEKAAQIEECTATIKNLESQLSAALADKERVVATLKASSEQEKDKLVSQVNLERTEAVKKLEDKITELTKTVGEKEQDLNSAKAIWEKEQGTRLQEVQVLTADHAHQIKALEDQIVQLKLRGEESAHVLSSSNTSWEKQLELMRGELEEKNRTISARTSELEDSRRIVEEIRAQLEKSRVELKESVRLMNSAKAGLETEKDTLVSEKESRIQEQSKTISKLESQVSELRSAVAKNEELAKSVTANAEKTVASLKTQVEEREKSITEMETRLGKLQVGLDEKEECLKSERAKWEAEKSALVLESERDLEHRSKTVKSLEEELTQMKKLVGVQDERLKAVKEAELQAVTASNTTDEGEITLKLRSELDGAEQNIHFLNSIIVDLQTKNTELKQKLDILLAGGQYEDTLNQESSQVPSAQICRLYCDICGEFDIHDTEDCPTQSNQENNSKHHAPRRTTRPYCETCEVFGHSTGSCNDEETF